MDTEVLCNDFLWYSYFGTSKKSMKDKDVALTVCIDRAYRDTHRSLDFMYKTSQLKKKHAPIGNTTTDAFNDAKNSFRANPILRNSDGKESTFNDKILSLITIEEENFKQESFDEKHHRLCRLLVREAAKWTDERGVDLFKPGGFTYGHAQKWINMAIKYMRMTDNWAKEFNGKDRKLLQALHVPIDGYIIKAAKADASKPILKGCNVKGLGMVVRKLGKWSNISNYCQYFDFQKKVRDLTKKQNLTPVEWEAQAWIAQAMKEASKS